VIVEPLLPEQALDDPSAVMTDLHMMVIAGGRLRTLQEFEALLVQSGFSISTVRTTSAGLTIIDAAPAM
jgi:hypothetical protein